MIDQQSSSKPVLPNYEDARQFNRRGLFIGGCPKSGTTLLLSLLDGHPQLVVLPEETFYLEDRRCYAALKNYPAKLQWLLDKTNLRLLANGRYEPMGEGGSADVRDYTGFNYKHFATLSNDFINQPWMNDSLLFSEAIRAYAIALGSGWNHCIRWIEKSTSNEVRVDALQELYPDAKLIQVVRDPRAVFASRKKRAISTSGCYTKAHRLVREWNRSLRESPRLRNHPDKFLVICYEDLVNNPKEVLMKICQFAGFDFIPTMLKPTRAGEEWYGNSSFQDTFKEVNSATVDLWKSYLTAHEIWWIEMHCRKGMEIINYPLQTDGRFSLFRWLKRLPGESWQGYLRARRASLCQLLGLLKECNYPV